MIHILTTKNRMTTAYYYKLLYDAFEKTGEKVRMYEPDEKVNADKNDIILAGGITTAAKYLVRGYKKVFVWFQGVVPEERRMQGASSFRVFVMSAIEKYVLRHAAYSIFVSEAMRSHYEKKYIINFKKKVYSVVPCFNEKEIRTPCFEKGIKKPLSFVYAGGMGVWQCFDQTMRVYAAIEKAFDGNTSLKVLTNCADKAEKCIRNIGIRNFTVKYAAPEELFLELIDQMYGFVFREDNPVNNVATPTKLSTYEAYGVIPVCSSAVMDFTLQTENCKYVIHINGQTDDEIIFELTEGIKRISVAYSESEHRSECASIFDKYYNSEYYINEIFGKCLEFLK